METDELDLVTLAESGEQVRRRRREEMPGNLGPRQPIDASLRFASLGQTECLREAQLLVAAPLRIGYVHARGKIERDEDPARLHLGVDLHPGRLEREHRPRQ